ncbi:methyltransferase [Streptomyces nitrosporeus]|uniref:methyltransferase n=1 Tax=Streptomyces nitrosporeus TaxID=28894 RepID=UPI0039A274E0
MTAPSTGRPEAVAVPDGTRASHAWRMREMIYGHVRSRAVCAAAELGLADAIGDRSPTAAELATTTGADPALLSRLLRALVSFGVLRRGPGGGAESYGLTPLGETLRSDAPASALPTALLVATTMAPVWERLTEVVRSGRPAFADVFGTDFFSHLDGDPWLRGIFDRSQETGLALELRGLLQGVDFSGPLSVVDVGGGDGALLTGLLQDRPAVRGVLVDLPAALPAAARRVADAGLAGRCELVEGDFLDSLPAGGDLYLLRHILHDWDDTSCRLVLQNCRRAMRPGARVVVVDHLADAEDGHGTVPGPSGQWGALMDLYMMSLFTGGRERTQEEIAGLFREAGLALVRTTLLPGGTGVLEARGDDFTERARDGFRGEKDGDR